MDKSVWWSLQCNIEKNVSVTKKFSIKKLSSCMCETFFYSQTFSYLTTSKLRLKAAKKLLSLYATRMLLLYLFAIHNIYFIDSSILTSKRQKESQNFVQHCLFNPRSPEVRREELARVGPGYGAQPTAERKTSCKNKLTVKVHQYYSFGGWAMSIEHHLTLSCKKGYLFSRPKPGCQQPYSSWSGFIKLFPTRESLVSYIPVGDGKIINLFLQCIWSLT